jgi:hypothetical protein
MLHNAKTRVIRLAALAAAFFFFVSPAFASINTFGISPDSSEYFVGDMVSISWDISPDDLLTQTYGRLYLVGSLSNVLGECQEITGTPYASSEVITFTDAQTITSIRFKYYSDYSCEVEEGEEIFDGTERTISDIPPPSTGEGAYPALYLLTTMLIPMLAAAVFIPASLFGVMNRGLRNL